MKKITGILAAVIFISCTGNKLEDKEQVIDLSYIAWACDCANWAKLDDCEKYAEEHDSLAYHSIFIEPADTLISLPDTLGFSGDIIRFTGHFYVNRGFPKGYRSPENPDKARVFRYSKYEVVRSNHHAFKMAKEELAGE